jgi:hypothetical protein
MWMKNKNDDDEFYMGDFQIRTGFQTDNRIFSFPIITEEFSKADVAMQEEVLKSNFQALMGYAKSNEQLHAAMVSEILSYVGIEEPVTENLH